MVLSCPAVKEAIRGLSLDRAQTLAAKVLLLDTAAAVQAYLAKRS